MTKDVNAKFNKAISELRFYVRSLSECVTLERLTSTYNYVWRSEGVIKGMELSYSHLGEITADEFITISNERNEQLFKAMDIFTEKLMNLNRLSGYEETF